MTTTQGIVVVDVSLALKWELEEADSPDARQLLAEWAAGGIQPVVPSWFACEASNALYKFVRWGNPFPLTVAEATTAAAAVMALVVVAGDEPADAIRALEIAHEVGEDRTYDAQYAALAERLGCALWTADGRFWQAAHSTMPWVHNLQELAGPAT
jgi:predicted nucleic acid-binding protein